MLKEKLVYIPLCNLLYAHQQYGLMYFQTISLVYKHIYLCKYFLKCLTYFFISKPQKNNIIYHISMFKGREFDRFRV